MPTTSFDQAVTVITGAASGIGRACAALAADKGARLVLTDVRADPLDQLVDELRAGGAEVLHHAAFDITDADAITAFADDVHTLVDAVDIVMNVAGIAVWGRLTALQTSDWDRTIDVNLRGPIHIIQAFVAPMVRAGRRGHLVNVSSAAGLLSLPLHAPYSAAKFGLRGVGEVLRFDLAADGIAVTTVYPGAVDTGLVSTVDVVGIDRDAPEFVALTEKFRAKAVSPERAAEAIVAGVEKRKATVFTSRDIALLFAVQRHAPVLHDAVATLIFRRARRAIDAAMARSPSAPS